jgi:hypothetical protein
MDQGRSLPAKKASTAGQELGPQEEAGASVGAIPNGRLASGTGLHWYALLIDDRGGGQHHHRELA